MSIKHIIDYFTDFGKVVYFKIDKRRSDLGNFTYSYFHRGCGFVQFEDLESRKRVLKKQNHIIEGCYFSISPALNSSQKKHREATIKKENRKIKIVDLPKNFDSCEFYIFYFG